MKVVSCSLWLSALLTSGIVASAQIPLIDFTGGISETASGSFCGGFEFRVLNPLTINALGFWDEGANGLTNTHQVGLWNFNGSSLLALTTVTNAALPVPSTQTSGRWLAMPIDPLVLTPGTYVLGATYARLDADKGYLLATTLSIPNVAFVNARQSGSANPISFPGGVTGYVNGGIFGPNAFLLAPAAVPEPGSVALLIGMASVSGMMLRRRRK